jgi:hypothetical protein
MVRNRGRFSVSHLRGDRDCDRQRAQCEAPGRGAGRSSGLTGAASLHGHVNALPELATLWVSLLAPGVTYPDHAHPPEALNSAWSPGRWRQNRGSWLERGPRGLVRLPPGITHGMQADPTPLLALWLLWSALLRPCSHRVGAQVLRNTRSSGCGRFVPEFQRPVAPRGQQLSSDCKTICKRRALIRHSG